MVRSAHDARDIRPRLSPAMRALAGSCTLSVITLLLVVSRHRLLAGAAALVAGSALIVGTVAARSGRAALERFAELVVDRVFDASVLLPVAWAWRRASEQVAVLALVGLAGSYVASYERARGRALGYRGSEAVGYRGLRVVLLSGALLTGWMAAGLWAFAVLTVAAAGVRAWNVVLQDRRRGGRGRKPALARPGAIGRGGGAGSGRQ